MNEQDFFAAILDHPHDSVPRLVYADWLDEQGDARGELIRIQEQLRQVDAANRDALETRMRELLEAGVKPLASLRMNSLRMNFVLVFPGEFLMGSPRDEAGRHPSEHRHRVQITEPFYLSCFPLTERDYFWIHDDDRDDFSFELSGVGSRRWEPLFLSWYDAVLLCNRLSEMENLAPNYRLTEVERGEGDPRPIERAKVEWMGTKGYRLPSEAEWEYACRAGTTTATPYGDELTRKHAHFLGSRRKDLKVGRHAPNGFGLWDMLGNAWEWCWDWLDDEYYRKSPAADPTGPPDGRFRVARGGGRQSNRASCRSAFRNRLTPTNNSDACLRLVLPFPAD